MDKEVCNMMMNDKISVIVPVYNSEDFLCTCIESIRSQEYQNWEAILVDDGSTDHSGAIAEEYAHQDSRITVIHKGNGGVSSARNTGLDTATGTYILFLDSDDELLPGCMNALLQAAEQHHADIVAGKAAGEGVSSNSKILWDGEEALRHCLMDNPITYTVWAKLFRRTYIGDTRFQADIHINEDSYFIFLLLCKQPIFIGIPEEIYRYRVHDKSASRAAFSDKFFDILRVSDKKYNTILEEYPHLSAYAENMRLKARMNMLHILALRTKNEYQNEEKELLSWILANRQFYIPATKRDDIWMFLLTHHLYKPYKWLRTSLRRLHNK